MRTDSVKGYNGWPNRETWNVMLWLYNDEGAYRYYTERLRRDGKPNAARAKLIALDALGPSTPDGIDLDSSRIRWGKIAEAMRQN